MRKSIVLLALMAFLASAYVMTANGGGSPSSIGAVAGQGGIEPAWVVFGYNDLGMHCMNEDFSELCVLPPANTLRAQVIDRREDSPKITTSDLLVRYEIPGNTESISKTNFWDYEQKLFGVDLPPNVGLFGFGLSGAMQRTADRDFAAPGIPVTPVTDLGQLDAYQLATISVIRQGQMVASTQAVIPVSWEMSCNSCHRATSRGSVADSILRSHDRLHKGSLAKSKPVLCARCHADPALGAPGRGGISTLSSAMHRAHATRMGGMTSEQACYSCHPGPTTQCLRDVHKARGMTCTDCHGGMAQVGNPTRRPWIDEPRCGDCHNVPGHEYEPPGVLFRDAVGHNGVKCITCHGSPHAITPSMNPRDNLQAVALQGYAGPISKCSVCHRKPPEHAFNHTRGDD